MTLKLMMREAQIKEKSNPAWLNLQIKEPSFPLSFFIPFQFFWNTNRGYLRIVKIKIN